MPHKFFIVVLLIFASSVDLLAQDVFGKWKTVDDYSGKAKSIIEIYEENGKVYGKIVELINPKITNPTCDKCSGIDKDQPMVGLQIIKGLEKDGDEFNGGKILDPENGKLYKCYITLEELDTLKVRGYMGISLFGRTQYWYRVK
jgi:uncharacterized protein (DUF2147 family)